MIKYEDKNRLGETGCHSKRQMDLLILNTPRRQHWTWADLRLWPRAHEWVLSVSFEILMWSLTKKKIIIESWEAVDPKEPVKLTALQQPITNAGAPVTNDPYFSPKRTYSMDLAGEIAVWCFTLCGNASYYFLEIFCLWSEDEKLYLALKMFQQ